MNKWGKVINCTGAMMTVCGFGGLGSACEGQGSFLISAIVLAIGLGLSLIVERGKTIEESIDYRIEHSSYAPSKSKRK